MNNLLFLDIDGVLNCPTTKDKIKGFRGIEDKKVELLKTLVDKYDFKIILSSTWRMSWEKEDKSKQDAFSNYLDKKLLKYGLTIYDKTIDIRWNKRGSEIFDYLKDKDVDFWVVLDDEIFIDFYVEINNDYVCNHWINTGEYKKASPDDLSNIFFREIEKEEIGLTEDSIKECERLYHEFQKINRK